MLIFFQVSLRVTVLLNTGNSSTGFLVSLQKYPSLSNWNLCPAFVPFSDGSNFALDMIFRDSGFRTDSRFESAETSGLGSVQRRS